MDTKPTIITVYGGVAEVVRSTVTVELLDYDITPGADEESCHCTEYDPEGSPHSHAVTEPTVLSTVVPAPQDWYIAENDGIECTIRDKSDPTEDGDGVVCRGVTPPDAERIIAVPQLLDVLGRLLATEDDYPGWSWCHWCQNDPHTDGCPGVDARALLLKDAVNKVTGN